MQKNTDEISEFTYYYKNKRMRILRVKKNINFLTYPFVNSYRQTLCCSPATPRFIAAPAINLKRVILSKNPKDVIALKYSHFSTATAT